MERTPVPKIFVACFGQRLVHTGVSLFDVQMLMRHESIQTNQDLYFELNA